MEVSEGVYDFRLENDSTMIITGPSKSGKTTFVIEMIKNKDKLFHNPIHNIWWFYGIKSPIHDEIKKLGVMMKEGIPTHEDLNAIKKHDLVILDDLQQETKSNDDITSVFLKASHHRGFFAIQITQYIYGDKEQRMRNANVHYYVAFNNPRNQQQIGQFLSKMFPKGNIHLIHQIFNDIIKNEGKYGYIFVDFTSKCEPDLRLRTNLFKKPMLVFKLNQNSGRGKMDYSEMIVIPKSEYNVMREQKGGGDSGSALLQKMEEEKKIKDFMEPEKSYVESIARRIVKTNPNVYNVNRYNMLLSAFDKIRRNFFKIPLPDAADKKPQVQATTQTHRRMKHKPVDDDAIGYVKQLFKTPKIKPKKKPVYTTPPFQTPPEVSNTMMARYQNTPTGRARSRPRTRAQTRRVINFEY